MRELFKNINVNPYSLTIFTWFAGISLVSIFAAIATREFAIAGLPILLVVVYLAIVDFKAVFFLLLAFIPLSTEVDLVGGFATDLPTEPLIVGLMLVYVFHLLKTLPQRKATFLRHTIILCLLAHWVWIFVSMVNSNMLFVSLKYFLAKTWYIFTFVFLTAEMIRDEVDFKKMFWVIFTPFTIAVTIILARHYFQYDMNFADVNYAMFPFFRNHVNYAALLAVFFPFIGVALTWYKRYSWQWCVLAFGIVLYLAAIQFSYTRTAYIALFLAGGTWVIIRFKLMKHMIALAVIGAIVGGFYVVNNNKYIDYAPDYERTITHQKFDNLVEATYQLEDISTMERVYRWVAGVRMSKEELAFGFGPGNFYNFYKQYTLNRFRTYVSDNPEKSSVHSYYLLVLIEQGIIGALIYLILSFVFLIQGERIYHQTTNKNRKNIVLTLILSMVIIDAFLLINDMIETDKIGSFFFMNIALLVNMDLLNRKEQEN